MREHPQLSNSGQPGPTAPNRDARDRRGARTRRTLTRPKLIEPVPEGANSIAEHAGDTSTVTKAVVQSVEQRRARVAASLSPTNHDRAELLALVAKHADREMLAALGSALVLGDDAIRLLGLGEHG